MVYSGGFSWYLWSGMVRLGIFSGVLLAVSEQGSKSSKRTSIGFKVSAGARKKAELSIIVYKKT